MWIEFPTASYFAYRRLISCECVWGEVKEEMCKTLKRSKFNKSSPKNKLIIALKIMVLLSKRKKKHLKHF